MVYWLALMTVMSVASMVVFTTLTSVLIVMPMTSFALLCKLNASKSCMNYRPFFWFYNHLLLPTLTNTNRNKRSLTITMLRRNSGPPISDREYNFCFQFVWTIISLYITITQLHICSCGAKENYNKELVATWRSCYVHPVYWAKRTGDYSISLLWTLSW